MTGRKMRKTLLSSIPLETERLVIRYIGTDDAYDMFEYASVPEVTEYLLWEPHVNLEATEGYIEFLQKRYKKGLYADWALELKENRKMIGTCGYAMINSREKKCEIGYVLSPEYRKQGYMTEAVKAILDLTFEKLQLESASLRIISENTDSVKLAKRMGFSFEYESEMEIKEVIRKVSHYVITREVHIKNEAV